MIKLFPAYKAARSRARGAVFCAFPAVLRGGQSALGAERGKRQADRSDRVMYTDSSGKNTDILSLDLFGDDGIMSTAMAAEQQAGSLEEKRLRQLRRLAGRLLDRLEEAIEGEDFSPKELRAYTNTLMDLREIQMIDPEKLAAENELKLKRMRRDAGDVQARELHISFSEAAAEAAE